MYGQYQPMEQITYNPYFPNTHEGNSEIEMDDSRGLGIGAYGYPGFGFYPPFFGYPGYWYNYGASPFYGYPGFYHRPRPYFYHGWHHGGHHYHHRDGQ